MIRNNIKECPHLRVQLYESLVSDVHNEMYLSLLKEDQT